MIKFREDPIKHKLIICSYKNFERVKAKFPNKTVVADKHCDNKFAAYIRKYPRGIFNIKVDDWSIWKPAKFPYFIIWRPKK
jgi:hypothetical protein